MSEHLALALELLVKLVAVLLVWTKYTWQEAFVLAVVLGA